MAVLSTVPSLQSFSELLAWVRSALDATPTARLLSLSLPLPPLDPLVAWGVLGSSRDRHYYQERPATQEAIVAVGPAALLELNGPQRFQQAQTFINACLTQGLRLQAEGATLGPSFCCSFSFFEDVTAAAPTVAPATVFLPRWQVRCQADRSVLTASFAIVDREGYRQRLEEVWQVYRHLQAIAHQPLQLPPPRPNRWIEQQASDPQSFRAGVETILAEIASGRLHKGVLARCLEATAESAIVPEVVLDRLRQRFADCAIFSCGDGRGSVFLGATPERLAAVEAGQLVTEALAGSAPRGETAAADQALGQALQANPKELQEHQLVAQFIRQTLNNLGLEPRLSDRPQLRRLSNIQHLHTPIAAPLPADLPLLDVVAQLHPTPAVAGLPKQAAEQAIRRLEPFERSLYAAPVGWVDDQGNGEFLVGIRSALIQGHRVRLCAGAGIVPGSHPDQELVEVDLKLQAMLGALI
ncbi:isochorismate synthase [Synechococcus elongatus]|uniref:isochorismate synthase n=1 Tax=Synechococcus elongatus TaxID=32046 RepID=UPI0030D2676A